MEVKGGIVKSNLKKIVSDLEQKQGRRITHQEISDATGLRRATITKWMSPSEMKLIDSEALTKLAQYAGVAVGDLLHVEFHS